MIPPDHFFMRIVVIIGDTKSGKSTLIRNLTGIYKGQEVFSLGFVDGERKVFVRNSALQEYNPKQPERFLTEINELSGNPSLAIIPLRVKAAKGCPRGEDYIMALIGAGHEIELIVKLSKVEFINSALNTISLDLSTIKPWNLRAALVRTRIGLK